MIFECSRHMFLLIATFERWVVMTCSLIYYGQFSWNVTDVYDVTCDGRAENPAWSTTKSFVSSQTISNIIVNDTIPHSWALVLRQQARAHQRGFSGGLDWYKPPSSHSSTLSRLFISYHVSQLWGMRLDPLPRGSLPRPWYCQCYCHRWQCPPF